MSLQERRVVAITVTAIVLVLLYNYLPIMFYALFCGLLSTFVMFLLLIWFPTTSAFRSWYRWWKRSSAIRKQIWKGVRKFCPLLAFAAFAAYKRSGDDLEAGFFEAAFYYCIILGIVYFVGYGMGALERREADMDILNRLAPGSNLGDVLKPPSA